MLYTRICVHICSNCNSFVYFRAYLKYKMMTSHVFVLFFFFTFVIFNGQKYSRSTHFPFQSRTKSFAYVCIKSVTTLIMVRKQTKMLTPLGKHHCPVGLTSISSAFRRLKVAVLTTRFLSLSLSLV